MNFKDKEYSIPKITIGCEALGGVDWGNKDLGQLERVLKHAYELGFNSFDTADVYGLGKCEERLSKIFKKNIKDIFIITKFGVSWQIINSNERAVTKINLSTDYLDKALHDSLTRLKIDSIPLYLVHWPNNNFPIEPVLNQLQKHKKSGKIINYGISNFTFNDITNANLKNVDAVCNSYSLINKSNQKFLTNAREMKIKSFVYGTLEQGLLSGSYDSKTKFSSNDRRSRLKEFQNLSNNNKIKLIKGIRDIAEKNSVSMSQLVFLWTRKQCISDSIIVGFSNSKQLDSLKDAQKIKLPNNDIEKLNLISKNYLSKSNSK